MKTAAVVSYSSYQKFFVKRLIKELEKFITGEIVVVSFDRFFDGKKEEDLESFGHVDLRLKFKEGNESVYYHNLQRKSGFDVLQDNYDGVFFLDGDEVPNGDLMKEWIKRNGISNCRFLSYWHYRDTCFRSKLHVDSVALVQGSSFQNINWYTKNEREGFIESHNWKRNCVLHKDPMIHHYSWAGTKRMLMRKVRSWGHHNDMNWIDILNYEFDQDYDFKCPFRPNDDFELAEPFIGFTFAKQKEIGFTQLDLNNLFIKK